MLFLLDIVNGDDDLSNHTVYVLERALCFSTKKRSRFYKMIGDVIIMCYKDEINRRF